MPDLRTPLRKPDAVEEHQLVLNAAQIGVIRYDAATGRVTSDARACALYGLDPEVEFEDILGRIHPEDRDEVITAFRVALAPNGSPDYAVDYRIVLPDGEERCIEGRGRAFSDGSEGSSTMRFIGTVRDITARSRTQRALAQSEQRYRTLFASIDQGYCLCEMIWADDGTALDYRFLEINPGFETMTGLVGAEGKTAREAIPGPEDAWIERYGRVVQEAQAIRVEDSAEALGRWFDVFATPVEPYGHFVIVFKDISERRRAERDLQRSEADLRALAETLEKRVAERTEALEVRNQELQAFAHIASHDLQEPLRKISVFADVIRQDYGAVFDQKGHGYLDRISDAAQRLGVLIRGLLAFSRLRHHEANHHPVDLAQSVRLAQHDLEVAIAESGTTFDIGELPTVQGEASQLTQLFQNLIGNAIKYRHSGTAPTITLRAEPAEAPHASAPDDSEAPPPSYTRITIQDDGIGFEAQYSERIFEPFKRLHTREAYAGSGIGLAICRRITEQHGGTLTATSIPGVGSTFSVVLPLAQRAVRDA